jgi:hypothetical protein
MAAKDLAMGERKPRTTGQLEWWLDGARIEQPPHADIAAANKWLLAEVQADRQPHGREFRLVRDIAAVTPKVVEVRKASLA